MNLGYGYGGYSGLGAVGNGIGSNFYFPQASSRGMGLGVNSMLSSVPKKFSFNGILSGTQKFLGTYNQIMPIYYQFKPIINNGRTMLKMAKTMRTLDLEEDKSTKRKNVRYSRQSSVAPSERKKEMEIPKKEYTSTIPKPFFN